MFRVLSRSFIPCAAFAAVLAWAGQAAAAPPAAATPGANGNITPARIAGERASVDLTVYNDGQALVREERAINLATGDNRVLIPDIPGTIDATSLHFASLTDPVSVRVLEQNYQYDLISQAKLLEKYLGKTVEFLREDPATHRESAVPGRILAIGNPDGGDGSRHAGMVAEIYGKLEMEPAGRLALPLLPEGLTLKPRLEWLLRSEKAGDQKVEISYLAGGLSWSCDYVALLAKGDSKLDLTGWVTLSNESGTAFRDAGLKLVAGEVHRVEDAAVDLIGSLEVDEDKAAPAPPQFQQKDLFEYKIYSLQRRTDLGGRETKQIELVSARNAAVSKILAYDGADPEWRNRLFNPGYRGQQDFGEQSNPKIGIYLAFRNDEKSGLGMPLPKGKVRVYKRDDDGKEQFIGEDEIDHTPKDEEMRLYLGNSFDVVGERAQIGFVKLALNRGVEETFRIKVRNHKSEAVEVMIYEHPWRWSGWKIPKTNVKFEKVDQSTIRFPVKIEPEKEAIVNYTIRYQW
ncbi:MAG: DUF4139 domain-containing protein [Fibrobacteres bacterium]|nr:DUF4139 domain-containing protein [Fibrobacterota bacterium]